MDFLGVIAGLTALLIPSDLGLPDRIKVAFVVFVILALLRFVSPVVATAKVVGRRVAGYGRLRFQLDRTQRELGQERTRTIDLARVILAYRSMLSEFSVTNAVLFDEATHLVVKTGKERLPLGAALMVIDPVSGVWLGKFEISRVVDGGRSYLAKPVDIGAPLWWGYLYQEAQAHAVPSMNAVAIVIPTESEYQ